MISLGKAGEEDRTLLKHLIATETYYKLDDRLKDEMISLGEVFCYESCEAITEAGSTNTNVYILMEGIIRSWHWDEDIERTSYFAVPGTIFMSLHSYMNHEPATCNIDTCCRCKIFRISKRDYDGLIEKHYDFIKWALSNAMYQLYYYEHKDIVIKGTARQRYEALMKDRPEIFHCVHLKTIASYLGISPQYLSRLRKLK